ncbi:MAG: hypothetical protein AUG45_03795 [Ktedonobacter sp. 13_1_20CM_3_54_15]|nr:MAG: hypothetical protein AUG45_03795 [Ktedonobacter sp. 13_1_20CM_3_54_15]
MAATSPFASPNEPGQRRADRRDLPTGTLTLLFTDIEGSTYLLQQLGEHYASALSECRDLLRAAFGGHHGHEVDAQGDAFFVAFARASDALAAAVAAQRALTTHPWTEGVAVRVRMGLHTGEPSLVPEGYVGLDVHYAARLMSAGHGGQVLLSQTTRDLVQHDLPDGVSLRDLGEHRLKDLQRPSCLYQLLIADLPADFPALKTLDVCFNNLPVQFTPLIGREQEVAAVQNLLHRENVRLVTLTGPGGTGKTRLGLQVAAELCDLFPDGVYFVNLALINDPAFVVPAIAQTLGLRQVAGQFLLERLKGELQQKQLLLVLDNFEQIVSAAPQLVDLLAACPSLKLLVTSREVLRVRSEHEFAVPPLAVPDPQHLPELAVVSHYAAVALFTQRAQAINPAFQVTPANARTIAEICVRLDGLPLAIELAAARVKLFPPQALLARLDQRLQVLTSGTRDAPVRQQSLRNTIAWSYDLLNAEEQRLFRRLSAFVGGCTLQAIEAVCVALDKSNEGGRVLDGVASLIDKSLLQQTEQEGEEPRLVMLETIREYGLEALETSGEMEAARLAHAAYYLRLSQQAEPKLEGAQQAIWLERLEREHDNLRAAMQWSLEQWEDGRCSEMALQLGAALHRFWQVRGHFIEGRIFLERALTGGEGVAPTVRVKALYASGNMALDVDDPVRAQVLFEEGLALSRGLGDTAGIALFLEGLGWIGWYRGNYTTARRLAEEALARWREAGDKDRIAWALHLLASLASQQGEYARARALCEEGVTTHRASGNKSGLAHALFQLAEVLLVSQGDRATVHSLLEESLTLSKELGDKLGLANYLSLAGRLALQQGDASAARSLIEEGLALYRETGYRLEGISESLSMLGKVAAVQGDYTAARALYEESLAFPGKVDAVWTASSLEGLAGVMAVQGEPALAARLYGAAEALRERVGTPIPPVEHATYERLVAAVRTQLDEVVFASTWAEGQTMTPEQALAAQGQATIPAPVVAGQPSPSLAKLPSFPAGLTTREVEVLCLLATGLTDAQIAEQLVLSLHTVHAHLRTIYSKLGVTSRSAATRYAFEHQLV